MMPLAEIDRLKQTVAGSWDSQVADQVAAQWGYPAGTAKWWRSSASHVFVLDGDGSRCFLRFVPGAYRGGNDVAVVARLVAQLNRGGSAVVRPVAAKSGARFGAFIAGYRDLRPLDDQDLDRLPLFAGLHTAASLVRITRALGGPAQNEPRWLTELRGKLTEKARVHRQLVIDTAAQVAS